MGCGGSREKQPDAYDELMAQRARQKEEDRAFMDSFTFRVASGRQTIGDRSGDPVPVIKPNPVGQLTTATGWLLLESGQWASRKNRIPADVINRYPDLADYEKYSLGKDNFISYKLYEMEYDGREYVLLVQTKTTVGKEAVKTGTPAKQPPIG